MSTGALGLRPLGP